MNRSSRSGIQAFTLIELLLVLALMAIFSSVFVLNIGSLLKDEEIETLEHEYWRAVDAARTGAVFEQQAHFIEWDAEQSSFLVRSAGVVQRFDVELDSIDEIEVTFEESAAENSYVLIAGKLLAKRPIAKAGFFPDGTCSPYSVSLKVGDFESRFQMDPWTGVQMVESEGDEAGI